MREKLSGFLLMCSLNTNTQLRCLTYILSFGLFRRIIRRTNKYALKDHLYSKISPMVSAGLNQPLVTAVIPPIAHYITYREYILKRTYIQVFIKTAQVVFGKLLVSFPFFSLSISTSLSYDSQKYVHHHYLYSSKELHS